MIELKQGNLLQEKTEALVNAVNCVGVMGKGIALEFKKTFPENFQAYKKACHQKQVSLGNMFIFSTRQTFNPHYIINFPTKNHWRNKSKINDIEKGLESLTKEVKNLNIKSISIPPLGCGNGGLEWQEIKPLITQSFAKFPQIKVILFEPFN